MDNGDPFWINDPKILYENGRYLDFFPTKNMTTNEFYNSLTRFFIYLIIIALIFTLYNLVYISLVFIVLFIILQAGSSNTEKSLQPYAESFCDGGFCEKQVKCIIPTYNNPFMNVQLIDYYRDPNKPAACDITDKTVAREAEQYMMYNQFFNAGDPFERKFVERSFYTLPVTTIPNDTIAFAQSLYKLSESCKLNPANCYNYEDIRFNRVNPALNGEKEIFYMDPFGNLN